MTQDNEALLQQFATIHNITWRHGQENAITQILDAHSQNKKCVILDAPTGAGKSLIAMATAWCLAKKRHASYILVSDLALQRQYSQDFAKLKLNYPSVMGVKNYECHESKTPVSVGWCSGNLVKLGVKRKDLSCYSTCGYYSARDAAQNSSVALLNYAYWLMQMNYVNLRLRRGEQSEGAFSIRDAQFFDEAHKIDVIVHSHCAVKLDSRLSAALSSLKHIIPPRARNKTNKLIKSISTSDRQTWFDSLLEIEDLLAKMEAAAVKWRLDLDPTVKKWDSKTTQMMHACADLRDAHCKIEDYVQIVKPSQDDMTLSPADDGVTFNTLDTKALVKFMLTRSTSFRVFMSATWGSEETAKRAIGADDAMIIKLKSDFDFSKSAMIIAPSGDMSAKKREDSLPEIAKAIDAIVSEHADMKGVIHTSSFDIRDKLFSLVSSETRQRLTPYDDSKSKETALRQHHTKNDSVLIGPSLIEGINLPDEECRFIIFAKCPFPYLGDDWTAKKATRDRAWYEWKTSLAIEQGCGRGIRHSADWCNVFFLDTAFVRFFNTSKSFSELFLQRIRE